MLLKRSCLLTGAELGAAAEQTECSSGWWCRDRTTVFTKPPVCHELETNRIGPSAPRAWEHLERKGGAARQGKGTDEGSRSRRRSWGNGASGDGGWAWQTPLGTGDTTTHSHCSTCRRSKSTQPPRQKTEGQNVKATVLINILYVKPGDNFQVNTAPTAETPTLCVNGMSGQPANNSPKPISQTQLL